KGIVSALGPFESLGPGTWIQTDAAINSGMSGGPLLNDRGEATGMITQKVVKEGVSGIAFAQSAADVLRSLKQCDQKLALENMAEPKPPDEENGIVDVFGPEGAEIFIDKVLVGMVPATLKLSPGKHDIRVRFPGQVSLLWLPNFYVLKGSRVQVKARSSPS